MKKKLLMGLLCVSLLSGCNMTTKDCDCTDSCKEETQETEKVEITKEQVYDMVEKYLFAPANNILDSGLTDRTMIQPAVLNTKVKYEQTFDPAVLKNVAGVSVVDGSYVITFGQEKEEFYIDEPITAYDYEGLNESYQELYGKTLEKKDYIGVMGAHYKYDAKEDVFYELYLGTGTISSLEYGIKEIKEENNKLTVLVGHVVFYPEDIGSDNYNSDEGITVSSDEKDAENFGQTMVEKYADKVNNTELVFEKKNGNYVLVSATVK